MSTVRVAVTRLTVTAPPVGSAPGTPDIRSPRRRWSQRRLPAGLVLVLAAGVTLACTVDVFRVHITGARPSPWRRTTVDWLAGHGPGDLPVTIGATGAALVGLWLLVLALTPGRRGQLMLAAAGPGWNAAIDRSAVASLIRDAVNDVPGTQDVKVRVGRRRIRVRGEIAFGDGATARAQAHEAAAGTLTDCDLRRVPRLRIVLRPAVTWQQPDTPQEALPVAREEAA
nr:DUF6286 domain-containing protein [Streptomyces sp. SID14478]